MQATLGRQTSREELTQILKHRFALGVIRDQPSFNVIRLFVGFRRRYDLYYTSLEKDGRLTTEMRLTTAGIVFQVLFFLMIIGIPYALMDMWVTARLLKKADQQLSKILSDTGLV